MSVITPNFLTFAGGEIHMGVLKTRVPTSIVVSVPVGIVLLEKLTDSRSTVVKLVQSTKLSLVCISKLGLNNVKICSIICNF